MEELDKLKSDYESLREKGHRYLHEANLINEKIVQICKDQVRKKAEGFRDIIKSNKFLKINNGGKFSTPYFIYVIEVGELELDSCDTYILNGKFIEIIPDDNYELHQIFNMDEVHMYLDETEYNFTVQVSSKDEVSNHISSTLKQFISELMK